jgi:hypothetical protein
MFIPPYVISGNLTYRVLLERRKKEKKKEMEKLSYKPPDKFCAPGNPKTLD